VSGTSSEDPVQADAGASARGPGLHGVDSAPALFAPEIPGLVVGHFGSVWGATVSSDQIVVRHSASYVAHPSPVRSPNGSVR
jgi:hypothetical protein